VSIPNGTLYKYSQVGGRPIPIAPTYILGQKFKIGGCAAGNFGWLWSEPHSTNICLYARYYS